MATIYELINKLQEIEQKQGNVEVSIYHSHDKKTSKIDVDQIYFDDQLNDVYIGIYN